MSEMKTASLGAGSFSVFRGDTAHKLPEGTGKIAHILKAADSRNIGNIIVGFHQQLCSLLNAVMFQILYGCGTDGGTEAAQTFAFADRCTGGNGSGTELASVLAVDTGKHGFYPLCIPETLLTDGRSGRGQVAVQKPDKF